MRAPARPLQVAFVERPSARAKETAEVLRSRGMVVTPLADLAAARDCFHEGRLHPDVVLMNALLPDGRGEDLLPTIAAMPWRPRIVLVAPLLEHVRPQAYEFGVAVVPDPLDAVELAEIVWSSTRGRAPNAVDRFQTEHALSEREAEIVAIAAQGADNKGIAQRLQCSLRTVQTHWLRIYEKSGHSSVQEILATLIGLASVFDWPPSDGGPTSWKA